MLKKFEEKQLKRIVHYQEYQIYLDSKHKEILFKGMIRSRSPLTTHLPRCSPQENLTT